ncbi:TPA: hypothetical protein O7V39_003424 [Salmonella enterica]|nr:hypothetical protein [Salmonella enterica]HDC1597075.1 hypothetical protein [Salmonella enterica]HDC1601901.1 hypothetical protein [Salmonella enterica]
MLMVIFLLLCLSVLIVMWCRPAASVRTRRHRRYRKTALRILMRLPELSCDGARLNYLRKINPYVFEELLLLALEKQGFGELLAREGCCGFFIHTGRTGHMSRLVCSASPRLFIISGQRLLDLLAGQCSHFQRKSL